MNETSKKIDDASYSEIKMLQGKFQELIFSMGSLQVERIELDRLVTEFVEKEKRLKEEWIAFKKTDERLRDKLVATYGEGSLNMENGTFTPVTPPSLTVSPPTK